MKYVKVIFFVVVVVVVYILLVNVWFILDLLMYGLGKWFFGLSVVCMVLVICMVLKIGECNVIVMVIVEIVWDCVCIGGIVWILF